MKDASHSEATPEPGNLRFLRLLVSLLTGVMILGLLTIIGLMILKFNAPALVTLPSEISLPADTQALSVTFGPGWYAVVTQDQRILIFDKRGGALRQEIPLQVGPE